MKYHIIAYVAGFILDILLGDPENWPHPVRLIGKLIERLDVRLMGEPEKGTIAKKADGKEGTKPVGVRRSELRKGILLVVIVVAASALMAAVPLFIAWQLHPVAGCALEAFFTYRMLAIRSLIHESGQVMRHLERNDLPAARKQVGRIVGRDTENLDEEGVSKAAIEAVAESACDGIAATMLYFAIGGPVLGFAAKAVNTMDSMVGYKNERYRYFGRCAARLDDAVNFFPARLIAVFYTAAAYLLGKDFSGKRAWEICMRDHKNSTSPNAGWPESAVAGALGTQLGGGAMYNGKWIRKPAMGDKDHPACAADIGRTNTLTFAASALFLAAAVAVMALIWIL